MKIDEIRNNSGRKEQQSHVYSSQLREEENRYKDITRMTFPYRNFANKARSPIKIEADLNHIQLGYGKDQVYSYEKHHGGNFI